MFTAGCCRPGGRLHLPCFLRGTEMLGEQCYLVTVMGLGRSMYKVWLMLGRCLVDAWLMLGWLGWWGWFWLVLVGTVGMLGWGWLFGWLMLGKAWV